MKKTERKLQQISGSLLISLPRPWVNQYNLKKGAKVEIGFKEDGTLILAPRIQDVKQKTETIIVYDKLFMRKFFRDYLSGTDLIKIIFKEKISKNEKKKLYDFIQNSFMNVQIIEETPEKIVLQNFRLEGISIKSCFQRMNHITASMFEDILNNEKESTKEKEKNLTKFYYMAVRLIRQYLQEGEYVQDTDMSLVKAMDYRLACEKIERLADELKFISGKKSDKNILSFGSKIYKEYGVITSAFLNENFETAIELWGRFKQYKKDALNIEKNFMKKKDFESIKVLKAYLRVLEYIKDISNLVRGRLGNVVSGIKKIL